MTTSILSKFKRKHVNMFNTRTWSVVNNLNAYEKKAAYINLYIFVINVHINNTYKNKYIHILLKPDKGRQSNPQPKE